VSDPFALLAAGADVAELADALRADPALAASRDAQGVSLVLQARYRGRLDAVEAILAADPPLDAFDAAALGRADVLAPALDADGGVAQARSGDGFTPLHLAAFFGHADTARLLLDRGADPAAVADNPMRVQPLHSAVAGRHGDLAALLVERGAPVNAAQHGGWTPLHAAAQHGDEALVDLLLGAGADPAAANDDGRTPADLADAAGHPTLAARLRA
jgi:ankyrin repeat protein